MIFCGRMIASENYKKPQRGGTTFKVQKSKRNTREERLRLMIKRHSEGCVFVLKEISQSFLVSCVEDVRGGNV